MNSTAETTKFDHWCLVELMGHQRVAGKVTEENLFGAALMRVDIPEIGDGRPGYTKYYGASAIYAITPVEERLARAMAKSFDTRPVEEWRLKRLLPEPVGDPGNEDAEGDVGYTDNEFHQEDDDDFPDEDDSDDNRMEDDDDTDD